MAFNKFEKMFEKLKKRKNFDKWSIPNKKGRQKCYCPIIGPPDSVYRTSSGDFSIRHGNVQFA